MKKLIVCLGLVMLLFGLAVAENGYTAEKTTKLVVGLTLGAEESPSYNSALTNGYFEKEGLIIEKKTFISGPAMMLAMANGEINVCVSVGYPAMLQAAAQGVDLKILLSTTKGNSPVVAGQHIKTFKDLNGKIVGTPGLNTLQNTFLNIAAKQYGIKFKKLVYGKATDLPVFLEKGEIDAFSAWEFIPADCVYRVKGAHYVLKWPVVKNAECVGMGADGKFYRENPEAVKKFIRAYLRGVKFSIENRKGLPEHLAKVVGRPVEVVTMGLANYTDNDPEIDIPSVKLMVEDMIEGGRLKKETVPDIDAFLAKYIDQTFLKELEPEVGLK
jgi:NitT/TauT family transport system substrate-binding protein